MASNGFDVESEIVEMRPSMSRSDYGIVTLRHTTFNQGCEAAQVVTSILLVKQRGSASRAD